MGNQRYKLRIGAHWKRAFFVEGLVFVHRPTVDFSSGRNARRENNLLPSNLLILYYHYRAHHDAQRMAEGKDSASSVSRGTAHKLAAPLCCHSLAVSWWIQFALAATQTSTRYRYTRTYFTELCSSPQVVYFNPGSARRSSRKASFGWCWASRAGKGRKNEEHAEEQSNSGQCSRRQTPDGTSTSPTRRSRPLSRIVINL